MKKRELEQLLREAGRVAREVEFFVIGSQAVHAYCRRVPTETLLSQECDLYPKNRPEAANLIEDKLGRRSKFARVYGFYADVVTTEIATLPVGWERRLKTFSAGPIKALCLDPNDLAASKLAAGRLKDLEFVGALLKMNLAKASVVRNRIGQFPLRDRPYIRARLQSVLHDIRERLRE